MKEYIVSIEVGNYDSPKNYELKTSFTLIQIGEILQETSFISATKNGTEYLINTKYIVSIYERRTEIKEVERPQSINMV